jgi:hypothetical protein
MKAPLGFDPREHDYGPATASVRRILLEWEAVDWFEPSDASDELAITLFREHNELSHAFAPELFDDHVDVRVERGLAREFAVWCKRVRAGGWDWKFGILKRLSSKQARARGWTLEQEAQRSPKNAFRPGDLIVRWDDALGREHAIWTPFGTSLTSPELGESGTFYRSFAQADALDCIQWQLAERNDELDANPFWPLIRCYRAGLYPFSTGSQSVVLFRFAADETRLPRAIVA